MVKKIILISGHGYNDPGAVSGDYNERDFIREHVVDTVGKYLKLAGHKVSIYGKNQDMYQDTEYGMSIGDTKNYGIYWVKEQGFDIAVEFHLDASSDKSVDGGHVIIAAGLEADDIDIGIQKAIEKHVDTIHGISKRDDLAHTRISKEIGLNYRLVELGFITNKGDMDYLIKKGNEFCKDIADAINGKEIVIKSKKKAPVKTKIKVEKPDYYTVKKGDSLYKIATAHNMTYQELMKINNLDNFLIKVGDKLKLKSSAAVKKKSAVQKAPSNKRIALKTKEEMLKFANDSVGQYFDYDGKFSYQCFDWANAYWHEMFKHGFTGMQAANIPQNNRAVLLKESTVYDFGGDVKMQPGDVVIWDWDPNSTEDFGHVAVAIKVGTNGMTVVEQNTDGHADKPANKRTCNFNGVEWFIRPNFKLK